MGARSDQLTTCEPSITKPCDNGRRVTGDAAGQVSRGVVASATGGSGAELGGEGTPARDMLSLFTEVA